MVNTSNIEAESKTILYNIWLFKLLRFSKYNRFGFIPILFISFLFVSGLTISIFYEILYTFLKLKILYLLLFAIFSALIAFQWYLENFPKLLASVFPIFRITETEYISTLRETKIMHKNQILIVASLAIALYGIIKLALSWSNSEIAASPIWFGIPSNTFIRIYLLVLIGICGIILGTGTIGYIESLWTISKICRYEIDLTKVYLLNELTKFNNIFTFWGIIAVSLFIVLVFNNFSVINLFYRNTPQLAAVGYSRLEEQQQTSRHEIPHSLLWGASLFVVFGTFVVILAFSYPQICFHFSIVKSKNKDLKIIYNIYRIYYLKLLKSSELNYNDIMIIDSLGNLKRDIEKTKTFFYDFPMKNISSPLQPVDSLYHHNNKISKP